MAASHAPAVLEFERRNRAWFARTITDRGDAFFDGFDAGFEALLAEQDAGASAYHLLLDDDGGSVLGRFNLTHLRDGGADLGYRVAEDQGGKGVGTLGVRLLCARAARDLDLRRLRAAAAHGNPASVRVLIKNGFVRSREADPTELGGAEGAWYLRRLDTDAERAAAPA